MRVTQQSLNLDDPDVRDVSVEVPNDRVPVTGDLISIDEESFRVLAAYPMGAVSSDERAVVLTVRRDRMDSSGVRESPKPPWPPALDAGAEATPPGEEPPEL